MYKIRPIFFVVGCCRFGGLPTLLICRVDNAPVCFVCVCQSPWSPSLAFCLFYRSSWLIHFVPVDCVNCSTTDGLWPFCFVSSRENTDCCWCCCCQPIVVEQDINFASRRPWPAELDTDAATTADWMSKARWNERGWLALAKELTRSSFRLK